MPRGFLLSHYLAIALLAGCGDGIDPTRSQADIQESLAPRLSASMLGDFDCDGPNDYTFYRNCWSAGQTIQLKTPAENQDAVEAAAADWNQYLTQHHAAPRFSASTSTGNVIVQVTGSGQTGWCGHYSETRDTIYMRRTCSGHTGSFAATMKHELAGLLGWSESMEGVPERFAPGMTSKCTVFLDKFANPKIINSEVCAHEADGVILHYAGLENTIPDGFEFFHDSIYMHVRMSPAQTTINSGDSVKVIADTSTRVGSVAVVVVPGSSGAPGISRSRSRPTVQYSGAARTRQSRLTEAEAGSVVRFLVRPGCVPNPMVPRQPERAGGCRSRSVATAWR